MLIQLRSAVLTSNRCMPTWPTCHSLLSRVAGSGYFWTFSLWRNRTFPDTPWDWSIDLHWGEGSLEIFIFHTWSAWEYRSRTGSRVQETSGSSPASRVWRRNRSVHLRPRLSTSKPQSKLWRLHRFKVSRVEDVEDVVRLVMQILNSSVGFYMIYMYTKSRTKWWSWAMGTLTLSFSNMGAACKLLRLPGNECGLKRKRLQELVARSTPIMRFE